MPNSYSIPNAPARLDVAQRDEINESAGVRLLITGGAGFIGSNLVDAMLADPRIAYVRVLDNLSTGFVDNFKHHLQNPRFEFLEGDIRDFDTCMTACAGMDLVSHQAALGSVPRSIADPLATNAVNITGMLHILHAAKESGIKRVVYAASSSTYGDSDKLPKVEAEIGKPLSPYAVTKYVNELYSSVYYRTYGLEVIGLRYFNVFGPRQSPTGAYAAAIPLFIHQLMQGNAPTINGDGSHSRDFTYVENAVQANLLALFSENNAAIGEVFNIAYGKQSTLLSLFETLRSCLSIDIDPLFGPERVGDIKHSLADIEKARLLLGYTPKVNVVEGLGRTVAWHQKRVDPV
ncbi:MAG: SDR family oxidoreductase [Saprospiraceae bacterium]|nr:SDR family oxidoreductase [Saprospiraceae bacterium]